MGTMTLWSITLFNIVYFIIFFPLAFAQLNSNLPNSPVNLTSTFCPTTPRDDCEVEVDVPEGCASNATSKSSCPIVFFLHGANNYNNEYKHTTEVHDASYIGVYVQGEKGWNTWPKTWNNCDWDDFDCTEDPDEVGFFTELIRFLRNKGANGNIYLVGTSNGGALAHKLASNADQDLPIKGIVSKVFQLLRKPERSFPGVKNYNQPSQARGTWPVSVLSILGENDRDVPYNGGYTPLFNIEIDTDPFYQNFRDIFELMSGLESMETWASHNGCDGSYAITNHTATVWNVERTASKYDYSNGCPSGVYLEHYVLLETRHDAKDAIIEGKPIDFDITYEFIEKVEKGASTAPSIAPSESLTLAPSGVNYRNCVDQPDYEFELRYSGAMKPCSWITENVNRTSVRRGNYCYENNGMDVSEVGYECQFSCDTCDYSRPTSAPVSCSKLDIDINIDSSVNDNILLVKRRDPSTRKFGDRIFKKGKAKFNTPNGSYRYSIDCLYPATECYLFLLKDVTKDGFTNGSGSFTVELDGNVLKSSTFRGVTAKSLRRQRKKFGQCS